MRINTNVASLTALESNRNTNNNLGKSLEKLSSGLKINKAADDASGLAIADKLRTQASVISQGIDNANSGIALLQIADKAMAEQSNIIDIVKQKLIQATTSTTSADGREAIRKDITKLLDQFDSIASQTNYNGVTLLQNGREDLAKTDVFKFQLGDGDFTVVSEPSNPSNTFGLGGGSEGFGAQSINSNITSASLQVANSVNGQQYGSGHVADNNIGVDGAMMINTSGGVTLVGVSISTNGVDEKLSATALDITISGDIGEVLGEGDIILDISSETQEVQNAVAVLVNANATMAYTADGTISMDSTTAVDFSHIDFSALNITASAADESITLNNAGTAEDLSIIIRNNAGQNQRDAGNVVDEDVGQINVRNKVAAETLTGGALLSELKILGEGELTADKANEFMATMDFALTQLNTIRADFGSSQTQIESSVRNMQTTYTNLKNAESVIRDVDYAEESANFNKMNIISQAGTYAISQANNVQQNIMKLLQ